MTATKSDQSINCNNQYSAVTVKPGSTTVTTSKADCISVQQELVNKTGYKQQKAERTQTEFANCKSVLTFIYVPSLPSFI